MNIVPDTNVLLRASIGDDPKQSLLAIAMLQQAEIVALTIPTLREFVWVLARPYKRDKPDIARAVRQLIDSDTVQTDRPAVEAGLAMLEAGGDFADGVIAFDGRRLGGAVFVSFDRQAVSLVKRNGGEALLVDDGV